MRPVIKPPRLASPVLWGLMDFGLLIMRYGNGQMTGFRIQDVAVAQYVYMEEVARCQQIRQAMRSSSSPMSETD